MIPTKKLVNSAETCVDESIEGFVALHPGVRQLVGQPRVVVRADIEDFKRLGKVLTLTGGGSGHEPCFTGKKLRSEGHCKTYRDRDVDVDVE